MNTPVKWHDTLPDGMPPHPDVSHWHMIEVNGANWAYYWRADLQRWTNNEDKWALRSKYVETWRYVGPMALEVIAA